MKNIYKIILSVAVVFTAIDISSAQTYSIIPNDTINMTGIMEDMETLSIQQLNVSNGVLSLAWQKLSENIPLNWETNVCDNVICYASLINGGVMNPVSPGDYGFLLVHVTPHVNYGTATIRYAVWDVAFPLIKDTLTYILTVNALTGLIEDKSITQISLYPNPTNESISFYNKALLSLNYIISDATGKLIERGHSSSELITINTAEYKDGVYYLNVNGEKGNLQKFKFVILQN